MGTVAGVFMLQNMVNLSLAIFNCTEILILFDSPHVYNDPKKSRVLKKFSQ